MPKKRTSDWVDESIKDRPIMRIGEFVNVTTKILWGCKACDHQWEATPDNVINKGSGCPKCGRVNSANKQKFVQADIERAISNKPILLVEEYKGYDKKITWECTQCNYQWLATPNNIISKNSGCPVCSQAAAGKKKSAGQKDRVVENLASKNLTLLSPYTRVKDKHRISCNICSYEFEITLNTIVNSNTSCAKCAGILVLANDIVDTRLQEQGRSITRVGEYVNATTKIEWQCEYGHRWHAIPDSVLNAGTGCVICKYGSQNEHRFSRLLGKSPTSKNVPTLLYVVRFEHDQNSFIKVGITTRTTQQRFSDKTYRAYNMFVLYESSYELQQAFALEQQMLQRLAEWQYTELSNTSFNGKTECFQDVPEVFEILRQNGIQV